MIDTVTKLSAALHEQTHRPLATVDRDALDLNEAVLRRFCEHVGIDFDEAKYVAGSNAVGLAEEIGELMSAGMPMEQVGRTLMGSMTGVGMTMMIGGAMNVLGVDPPEAPESEGEGGWIHAASGHAVRVLERAEDGWTVFIAQQEAGGWSKQQRWTTKAFDREYVRADDVPFVG